MHVSPRQEPESFPYIPSTAKPKNKRPECRPVRLEPPPLRLHKATGMGYVILEGNRKYLGRFDDARTRERYQRLVLDLLGGGPSVDQAADPSDLSPSN